MLWQLGSPYGHCQLSYRGSVVQQGSREEVSQGCVQSVATTQPHNLHIRAQVF